MGAMDDLPRTPRRTRPAVATAVSAASLLAVVIAGAGPAAAHTDSDVVAVPAAASATVTLEPTHGCGESPTVEVSIRAPMTGATPGEVAGWTATAAAQAATDLSGPST